MKKPRVEVEPAEGLYVDSTGVHYRAVCLRHTGWVLTRQLKLFDLPSFAYADFARAVRDGIFTLVPTPNP